MEPKNEHDWEDKPKRKQKPDEPKQDNWRELAATPQRLSDLFRKKRLPVEAWEVAQKHSGLIPTKDEWLLFADFLMSGMGTIFLLAGIVFFFAFNWDDLSKWHRFAIVEGAVIISTVLVFILNIDKWAGRLALGASTILLGVALVVVSQEYQTGADSYRLFQIWLMLITGWVLISRWNIMYLIWMVLLNITIGFYWEQIIATDWEWLNLLILLINASFVFLWDSIALRTRFKFMLEGRWFLYIFMVIALVHGTTLMSDYILDTGMIDSNSIVQPLTYLGLLLLSVFFYMVVRRDLLMLTFSALSFLVVAIIGSGRFLYEIMVVDTFDGLGTFIMYFLIMAIITVGLTAFLATQLRALHQNWETNHD